MVDYGADQRMDVRKREFGRGESEGMPAMKRLKSPKSTPSRGVSFSKDTKVFDGLSPASRLVDSVVWDFFMSQTVNSAEDIVQLFAHITDSCGCLHEVCSLLDDLRWRLDESGCALVLPGGSGSGAKLQEVHAPALHELCDITWQAYDDLVGSSEGVDDGSKASTSSEHDISGVSSECSSPNSSEADDLSSEDGATRAI